MFFWENGMERAGGMDRIQSENEEAVWIAGHQIERALAIQKRMGFALTALVAIDFSFLAFFSVYFIVLQDHAWFDFLEYMHVFLCIALIITIRQNVNVYRNLKYLLIAGILVFVTDVVLATFLRPLAYHDANPLNLFKRHIKLVLIIVQAIFTSIAFIAVILAVYYRYVSDLATEEVKERYSDLAFIRGEVMKNAVYFHLQGEAERVAVLEAELVLERERVNQSRFEMVRQLGGGGSAVPPPVAPVTTPLLALMPAPPPADLEPRGVFSNIVGDAYILPHRPRRAGIRKN